MSGPSRASAGDTRSQIISSLFNRRADDGVLDETYIAHLKIWEDMPPEQAARNPEEGGRKSRYLILAVTRDGKVQLHKAKRNTNMTFSKGKTWALQDMRIVEVKSPQYFALTMTSRTHMWQTERPSDQQQFLTTIVRIYNKFTQGKSPQLINFDFSDVPAGPPASDPRYGGLSPPSTLAPPAMRDRQGSFSSMASSSVSGGADSYYTSGSRGQPSVGRRSEDSNRAIATEQPPYGRSPLSQGQGLPSGRPLDPRRQASSDSTTQQRRPSASSLARSDIPGPDKSIVPSIPPVPQRQASDNSNRQQPRQAAPTGQIRADRSANTPRFAEDKAPTDALPQVSPARPQRAQRPPAIQQEALAPLMGIPGVTTSPDPQKSVEDLTPKPSHNRQFLAPIITTTEASPDPNSGLAAPPNDRRDMGRRATFVAPAQTVPYSREILLRGAGGSFSQAEQLLETEAAPEDLEDATLANVEEMLEGFDFGMDSGNSQQGTAEAIEARLLDELNALEAANIHAFLETDDRMGAVMKQLDEAVLELDSMDNQLTGYKMQLNLVTDDINYIESQNKGLQVQTSNQKALLAEMEQLLQIVQVDESDLQLLTRASPKDEAGIQALEAAAASLYKALQAGRDSSEMTAALERLRDYETYNKQFCLRVVEYLFIMFKVQADQSAAAASKSSEVANRGEILPHEAWEDKLGQYCGLVLYIKEMDEERYQKLCANYFSAASELHGKEMKTCLLHHINQVARPVEDDKDDGSFAGAMASMAKAGPLQRSKNAVGNLRGQEKKGKGPQGAMKASEAFDRAAQKISGQIYREEAFIADFLQITDNIISYADYMDMDSYFRRQASRYLAKGMQPATVKLRRSALDLIFGFLGPEVKDWVDGALQREPIQVFGIAAACERQIQEAESRNALFWLSILQRQHQRVQALLDRFINEQVKTIEAAKLTVKKRTGVAFFVKHFPIFTDRIEAQLVDCDGLNIRRLADAAYERIVTAMFDALQQMAKLDRSDASAAEDKGQLNYSIIMIENMYFCVSDTARQEVAALRNFQERAQRIYEDNLATYTRSVLRRSFGRPMDFFDAIARQLQTTAPTDIAVNPSYSRAALKRVVKDAGSAKDLRKAVEALAKRVEKHFSIDESEAFNAGNSNTESAALIRVVWTACATALEQDVRSWQDIISRCYADAAQGLEYGPNDVGPIFSKAKPL